MVELLQKATDKVLSGAPPGSEPKEFLTEKRKTKVSYSYEATCCHPPRFS